MPRKPRLLAGVRGTMGNEISLSGKPRPVGGELHICLRGHFGSTERRDTGLLPLTNSGKFHIHYSCIQWQNMLIILEAYVLFIHLLSKVHS